MNYGGVSEKLWRGRYQMNYFGLLDVIENRMENTHT